MLVDKVDCTLSIWYFERSGSVSIQHVPKHHVCNWLLHVKLTSKVLFSPLDELNAHMMWSMPTGSGRSKLQCNKRGEYKYRAKKSKILYKSETN